MYPTSYYIALGTNVGNYRNNFSRAVFELSKIGNISKIANIYKSKPYGYLKQNYFYNTMVYLKSEIHPSDLITKILKEPIARHSSPLLIGLFVTLILYLTVSEPSIDRMIIRIGLSIWNSEGYEKSICN